MAPTPIISLDEIVFWMYRLHRADLRLMRLTNATLKELRERHQRRVWDHQHRIEKLCRAGAKAYQQLSRAENLAGAAWQERGQAVRELTLYCQFSPTPAAVSGKIPLHPQYLQLLHDFRARLAQLFAMLEIENRQWAKAMGVPVVVVEDEKTTLSIGKGLVRPTKKAS